MTLAEEIKQRLAQLEPTELTLMDESAMHAGHAGNQGGGHFKLTLKSSQFSGKSTIMRHRMIYGCLTDMMPHRIHALSIEALAPNDSYL